MRASAFVASAVAVFALGTAGAAAAAPGGVPGPPVDKGNKQGFLVLTVGADAQKLAPGRAVKAAVAACDDLDLEPAVVTVDDVRAAFPEPVDVCDGVTLTSQVAADGDDEV